jgi:uncharacterized protein YndB with AHSA1/START domain
MSKLQHEFDITIGATPDAVWSALTRPETTRRFLHAAAVESDFRPGSPVRYRLEDGSVLSEGTVLEASPPRRLAITWRFVYDARIAAEPPSEVVFAIQPQGAQSRLTVVHRGFATATETYRGVGSDHGWPGILASLRRLLEDGAEAPPQ